MKKIKWSVDFAPIHCPPDEDPSEGRPTDLSTEIQLYENSVAILEAIVDLMKT